MTAGSEADNWFQDDQPRQGWAYFEGSDTWRPTPWHWGAPADHFPAELGDWVAVTKPGGWQPPAWGSGGKLAGADSEAGRREPPAEPWSVLAAGQEHLEHIGNGIGEAVVKGAAGAGQALENTWDALTTNEDLHKGVEFGAKAAWEVSKDVFKEAGTDAAKALGGYGIASKVTPLFGADPVTSILRNRGWGLANDGYSLFDESAGRAHELDQKIRSHLPKDWK